MPHPGPAAVRRPCMLRETCLGVWSNYPRKTRETRAQTTSQCGQMDQTVRRNPPSGAVLRGREAVAETQGRRCPVSPPADAAPQGTLSPMKVGASRLVVRSRDRCHWFIEASGHRAQAADFLVFFMAISCIRPTGTNCSWSRKARARRLAKAPGSAPPARARSSP
jgi:hypothetical protein